MTETPSLINMIKKPSSKIFRRFYVKRRQANGLFEDTWQELTQYVKTWGSYRWAVDTPRFGYLKFSNSTIKVLNIDGTFNPNDNDDSFWKTFGDIQRTLVKIEAGFTHQTLSSGGIWTNTDFPTALTMWTGIISGDIDMDGRGEVALPLRPITQVFRDYPALDVRGFTSTGISSGGWFSMLRDHTDGSGNFVFRPFIGDATSTDWTIATGGQLYANLNTSSAEDLQNLDCWAVTEKMAQAEQSLAYVNSEGKFIWQRKTTTASVQYEFHGLGSRLNERVYGHTIKDVQRYGKRLTSFYSRTSVKYREDDPSTDPPTTYFVNTGLAYTVDGSNTAWNLGQRTFRIDNFWLPNSAAAASVAGSVFDEVSSQSNEIHFIATFVPHLNLLDRISVTYDSTDFNTAKSLWDINDWDTTTGVLPNALIWDASRGDGIILNSTNFKILSINLNVDKMESTFIARQI